MTAVSLFFWTFSALVVTVQAVNHWLYGKGNLKLSYPLSIFVYSSYIIIETALAFNTPDQLGILLFNIVNVVGLVSAIRGWYRLRE